MKKNFILAFIIFFAAGGEFFSQYTYTYTGKPRYQVVTTRANQPIGTFTVELFPNIALHHVRNFDSLVSVSFYDSTAFHRVIPNFMIQGGDPNSKDGPPSTWGTGNPNQPTVNAEFSVAKHVRGSLSAARLGNNINSATSQFFICVTAYPSLNGQYTLYGHVTASMSVVDNIVNSPRDASDRPLQKVQMYVTRIGSNDTVPNAPSLITPPDQAIYGLDTLLVLPLKWSGVSDGIIYHLDVSTDPAFAIKEVSLDTPDLSFTASSYSLTAGTTYYWRVRVNNGGHFSAYTPTRSFSVWTTTGVHNYTASNNAVHVFPNPSSNTFTFEGLEKGSRLEVFDTGGKQIYSAVLKDNSLSVDLGGKDKGTYIYRIYDVQNKTRQGKLILK